MPRRLDEDTLRERSLSWPRRVLRVTPLMAFFAVAGGINAVHATADSSDIGLWAARGGLAIAMLLGMVAVLMVPYLAAELRHRRRQQKQNRDRPTRGPA